MAPPAAAPELWLGTFAAAVRARDFADGHAMFAADAGAFGTWSRGVIGLGTIVRAK